ncbi:MAG: PorP/SprF family type IX secretion system membrane protein [Bacteroidales bacterium]|nr:PorP/SprF family type IX secretion system membrane protein [Bacteroidales bacterium]
MIRDFTKKTIGKWFVLGVLMLNMSVLQAQDVDFSQFFTNPTYFNPAYVGLSVGMKVRFNYLKQWTGLSGNYHAFNFSADVADRNIPGAGGLGIIATSDQQGFGTLKTSTIGVIPAVRIPINDYSVFQMGALVSLVSRQIDYSNLVFADQLDPRLGNIGASSFPNPGAAPIVFPDFSLGGIYQFQFNNVTGTIGFAAHHITQPDQSFLENIAPLPRKYVAHMDFIFDFQKHRGFYARARGFKLNPGILYQTQAGMRLLAVGSNAYVQNVYAGLWYQSEVFNSNSISNLVWMAGLNMPFNNENRMKVIYSFIMNLSGNISLPGPSHQISLILELDNFSLINPYRMNRQSKYRGTVECSPF